MVEAKILQDYTLSGRRGTNPAAETLAKLARPVICASPSVFAPSTPEYLEIYEKFKVAKYWQKSDDDLGWSILRNRDMLYEIVEGDNELCYLKAKAERISASIDAITPRGMDSNPILDCRLESFEHHYASITTLIEIELKCTKAIDSLIANGGN